MMCSMVNEPPAPVPSTLEKRIVKFDNGLAWMDTPRFSAGRKDDEYWVNLCQHCGTILRDERLYDYYEGPFGHAFFESRNNNNNNKSA
jgi:hypothetical protein